MFKISKVLCECKLYQISHSCLFKNHLRSTSLTVTEHSRPFPWSSPRSPTGSSPPQHWGSWGSGKWRPSPHLGQQEQVKKFLSREHRRRWVRSSTCFPTYVAFPLQTCPPCSPCFLVPRSLTLSWKEVIRSCFSVWVFALCFETQSYSVSKVGLEFVTILLQPVKCDSRQLPSSGVFHPNGVWTWCPASLCTETKKTYHDTALFSLLVVTESLYKTFHRADCTWLEIWQVKSEI